MPTKAQKKTKEIVQKELIDSIKDKYEIEKPELEERVQNITDIAEAIIVIKKYEEIIRTQEKKIINIAGMQGQLLKEFKDNEIFFETLNQSKSTIYFSINLPKFLKKYPVLKKSTLSSNYFKNILS